MEVCQRYSIQNSSQELSLNTDKCFWIIETEAQEPITESLLMHPYNFIKLTLNNNSFVV